MIARSNPQLDGFDLGRPPPIRIRTRHRPKIGCRNGVCGNRTTIARACVVHLGGGHLFCECRAKVRRINPRLSPRAWEATARQIPRHRQALRPTGVTLLSIIAHYAALGEPCRAGYRREINELQRLREPMFDPSFSHLRPPTASSPLFC